MTHIILYGADEPTAKLSGPILDKNIPNSEFYTIRESGHFPFIEEPEQFLEIVRQYLK